MFQTFRMA
jgi:hypothetical protein